jgi:hypothetical protein
MKLGPLAVAREEAFAYLAFGEAGLEAAIETTDAAGLAALRSRCGDEVLKCEPALAECAAAHGLEVVELPQPALATKAALGLGFEHGSALEPMAPDLLLDLLEATHDFAAAEPWNVFEADEPLAIRVEPSGRVLEGCVQGAGGAEAGFVLYHERGSVAQLHRLIASGQSAEAERLPSTSMLLAEGGPCSGEAIRALTGSSVAPIVLHILRGAPQAAKAADVAVLIAALRAVTALAEGQEPQGQVIAPQHSVIARAARAARASSAPPAALYSGVGRNEPCPCGSGKKFKRCHLDAKAPVAPTAPTTPASRRLALHDRDERITAAILDYGRQRFDRETLVRRIDEALPFVKDGRHQSLLTYWVAYVLRFDGEPLGARYLRSQGAALPAEDRRWIERQLATPLSIWEVLRVEPGYGFDAVDLVTGARCFIDEVQASKQVVVRDALLGRAVAGDVVLLCGVHGAPLDPWSADRVVSQLRESTGPGDLAPRLLALWDAEVEEALRRAALPAKVTNTDGHDVAAMEDLFDLRRGGLDEAFARLAACDGAHVDERDQTGARFTFTRAGNAAHATWSETVIGTARLTPTRLVVETNSAERAAALVARLREALGDLATWKKQTREPLDVAGGEHVMIDAQYVSGTSAPPVRDTASAWLDQPLSSLGGRTPRAAVGDDDGRRQVHLMLKQQEHRHARHPAQGLDPAQSRRELGLDELGAPLAHVDLVRAIGAGRKLSETILDFAQPMIDAERAAAGEGALREVLEFAIAVWNAVVMATQADGTADPAVIREGLPVSRWHAWAEPLVARKRARFASDLRQVGFWQVDRRGGGLDVRMETTVAPELARRLTAAGLS